MSPPSSLRGSAGPAADSSRRTGVRAALLAASVVALAAFGLAGIGRTGRSRADFDFYYAAGMTWRMGSHMYDPAAFAAAFRAIPGANALESEYAGFAYPPHFAIIAAGFALLNPNHARLLCVMLSCLAVAVTAWTVATIVRSAQADRSGDIGPALTAAIAIGWPFTSHTLWLGQASMWVCAALLLSWYLGARGADVTAGALLGFASIKPAFVVLPLLYLALERRWRMLAAAAVAVLALSSYAFARLGPLTSLREWLRSLSAYNQGGANALGHHHVLGIPSMLAAAGLPAPGPWLSLGAGVLVVVLLWARKIPAPQHDWLAILMLIPMTLIYAHDAELIFFSPVLAAAWLHWGKQPSKKWCGFLLLAALCFPGRVVRQLGVPLLNHWRTLILAYALVTVIAAMFASRQEPRSATAPP